MAAILMAGSRWMHENYPKSCKESGRMGFSLSGFRSRKVGDCDGLKPGLLRNVLHFLLRFGERKLMLTCELP
jgi:hypothetical protein